MERRLSYFVKEVNTLEIIKNRKHVTNIKEVCYSLFVTMMHYSNFSSTSSLDEFLSFTDFMLESFETFLNKITFDVIAGLQFLHSKKKY